MAEELGERTEQPTGRRLGEARSKGQVPKSLDLSAAVDLIGSALVIVFLGGPGFILMFRLTRWALGEDELAAGIDPSGLTSTLMQAGLVSAVLVLPVFIITFAVALLQQYLQVGWLVTFEPLTPKFDRLNPVAGIKRLASLRQIVKTAVNGVKLISAMALVALVVSINMHKIVALPRLALGDAISQALWIAAQLVIWLLALLLLIGLVDWWYQRWQHLRDLRMTKQEVKDERRNMEGDPEIKARQFQARREMAMQRINAEVPRADVVVTNPTHFSVALRYDAQSMAAPIVVAKGADLLAWRVRQVAAAWGIPIVERPPLARALYYGIDAGRPIAVEHYEAVAEVLAYVYRLKGQTHAEPGAAPPKSPAPAPITTPAPPRARQPA